MTMPEGGARIYAMWEPNEYMFTLDRDGVIVDGMTVTTVAPDTADGDTGGGPVTFGTNAASVVPPTMPIHTFIGYFCDKVPTDELGNPIRTEIQTGWGPDTWDWVEADPQPVQYFNFDGSPSRPWDLHDDSGMVELYARWIPGVANVFFDINGRGAAPMPQVLEPSDIVDMSDDPHYNAYIIFGGWYTDPDCSDGNEWDFADAWDAYPDLLEDDGDGNLYLVLYARWINLFVNVDFDSNGYGAAPSSMLAGPGQLIGARYIPAVYEIIVPGEPEDPGPPLIPEVPPIWGPVPADPPWVVPDDFNPSGFDPVLWGDDVYRVSFAGWAKDPDGDEMWDWDVDTVPDDGTVLYAVWEILLYKVDFDTQGIGTAPQPAFVEWQSLVSEPDEPESDGYIFGGWYKDAACTDGSVWDFDNDLVEGDITLYARWSQSDPPPTPARDPEPTQEPASPPPPPPPPLSSPSPSPLPSPSPSPLPSHPADDSGDEKTPPRTNNPGKDNDIDEETPAPAPDSGSVETPGTTPDVKTPEAPDDKTPEAPDDKTPASPEPEKPDDGKPLPYITIFGNKVLIFAPFDVESWSLINLILTAVGGDIASACCCKYADRMETDIIADA